MKTRLLAAVSACLLLSAQALTVSADYGWDDGYTDYGYTDYGTGDYDTWDDGTADYGYTDQTASADDDTGYYTSTDSDSSSASDDVPLVDPFKDAPFTVKLTPTKIADKKFSAELFIDGNTDVSAADLTITYDSKVLKLNKTTISKKVKGTLAAAETSPGTVQLQYTSDGGTQTYDESSETDSTDSAAETKPGYLVLDFEIIDTTERSTVLYITVNSLRDMSMTEVTYRADGTIIQIEGAVPVDAAADESMYTELRVARSDSKILFDSIGLQNVKKATLSDATIATADEKGLTTLADGLTNMTVEFNDGSVKYYRLVVTETAPVVTTQAAESAAPSEVQPAAAETEAVAVADGEIVKTQTKSNEKVKYLIIYIAVILGIIAIFAEFFFFFGNPYKRAFALMSKRKSEKDAMQEALYGDDDTYPNDENNSADGEDTEYPDEEEDTGEEAEDNGENEETEATSEDEEHSDEQPEEEPDED